MKSLMKILYRISAFLSAGFLTTNFLFWLFLFSIGNDETKIIISAYLIPSIVGGLVGLIYFILLSFLTIKIIIKKLTKKSQSSSKEDF